MTVDATHTSNDLTSRMTRVEADVKTIRGDISRIDGCIQTMGTERLTEIRNSRKALHLLRRCRLGCWGISLVADGKPHRSIQVPPIIRVVQLAGCGQ